MAKYIFTFLPFIAGGLVQATTGFGSGIVVMLFLPLFLPILQATALSSMLSVYTTATLFWRYRKHLDLKIAALPAIFYLPASFLAIRLVKGVDLSSIKAIFGAFLILMALYFLFFSSRVRVRPGLVSAAVCGTLSGVVSGLFGIGGPPMVVYMLAATGDDKDAYIGNSQFFFAATTLYTTLLRVFNGILTVDLLPLAIPGLLGMFLGKTLGLKIVDRIDSARMKKLIYVFMAVSGVITLLNNI